MTRGSFLDRLHALGVERLTRGCWQPAADIYRDGSGWLVKLDLAGVSPSDVQIAVEGRRLTVSGVRRDLTVREGLQAVSMEIAYSRFERAVELPVELGSCSVSSECRDGMLLVRIAAGGGPA